MTLDKCNLEQYTPNCSRPSINYFTKFILRVKRDITVDVTESKSPTDVYRGRFKGGNQTFGEILVAKCYGQQERNLQMRK